MRDHEKVNEAASLVGRTPFRYRSAPPFAFQSFSISFGTVLVEASLFLQGGPLVFREERAIDIACCIAARFAFHLQEGGERRNRERHRKLTVIAFNVTRARTDQSQLLEVTESRGRRRNQLLSAFWWSSRAREPLFAKTYGGMFLSSLDGDSRRFRENDDDWEKNNDSKREGDWILKDAPLQEWKWWKMRGKRSNSRSGLLISVVPTILANKNEARNERKGEGTRKCPVIEQLWQSLYRIKTKMKKMWEKRRNSERGLFIYRFDDPYK